ncbi:MAG: nickel transporter [Azospirillum sp.]|nr:nickel transporter [Azospirillum sp.]
MQIIPVLDLIAGQVVQAEGGNRRRYRPIRSPLARSSAPEAVIDGLLGLHPFDTFYLADLDAIEGTPGHDATVDRLLRSYPGLTLWVDRGFHHAAEVTNWVAARSALAVVGSETLADAGELATLTAGPLAGRVVLSLDFRGDQFLGDAEVFDRPELWPARIIVMTLARVGSAAGPDVLRLTATRLSKPQAAIFAAGGVRDAADLTALATTGAAGALVATALHAGRLTPADLQHWQGR